MTSIGNENCDSNQNIEPLKLANERWKMVRSAIEHEDNLINQRLSWLFAGHAFLFICFAMLQSALLTKEIKSDRQLTIEMGLSLVMLCAAFIAMITHRNITLANIHSNSLRQWWIDNYNAKEWHYQDRSTITSLIHFFTCTQTSQDYKQVISLTQQELPASPAEGAGSPTSDKSAFPPIKGHFPNRRGSIAALIALMDLALFAVCFGFGCQGILKSMETSTTPRVVSTQPNDSGSSRDGGGGSDDGGGGSRSAGALDVP